MTLDPLRPRHRQLHKHGVVRSTASLRLMERILAKHREDVPEGKLSELPMQGNIP